MKSNRGYYFILLMFFTVMFFSCSREDVAEPAAINCGTDYSSHPQNQACANALESYVSLSQAPGSVIGIKKYLQQEWIGANGFSNLEHQTPFATCTPFRCGSITKVFTAVVVMKLNELGQLSLDATVAEVLPEIAGEIPESATMTVRQLLNHSSGLKHPTEDDLQYQLTLINNPEHIASMDYKQRLRNYVFGKALVHSPGTESYYSNSGYWILGMMIEKITGKSMQQNMHEMIFLPLGLNDTYLEKRDDQNVSRGYNFSGNQLKDVTIWDRSDSDGDPAAGLVSTAHDLLVFGDALFHENLVNRSSLSEMKITTSFPSCGGDCGYGLGIESWYATNYSGFGKNGSSMGVDANLIYFPDKDMTIVIFSNYGGGNRKDVIDQLLSL